ncbi:MAG: hypothetical protein AAF515_14450 [Pseudomonadota bacterium]
MPEPGRALARAYQAAGIDASAHYFTGRISSFGGADFDIRSERNEAGQETRVRHATATDGEFSSDRLWTYNGNGAELRQAVAAVVDGLAQADSFSRDRRTERDAFDAALRTYEISQDGTESPGTRYAYDTFGLPTLIERESGEVERWLLDADGKRVRYERDLHGEGVLERSEALIVDDLNRWLTRHVDIGDDGTIDQIHERRYAGFGGLVYESFDGDADGALESETTITLDAAGRKTREVRFSSGQSAVESWEYAEDGRLLRYTAADDVGLPPRTIETYRYDDTGRFIGSLREITGRADFERRAILNDDGLIGSFESYQAGELVGVFDIEYGDNGRLTRLVDSSPGTSGDDSEAYTDHVAVPLGHGFDQRF